MNEANSFARWQPEYAARGIALFPVTIDGKDKRPAIRNYLKIGKRASDNLASGRYSNSPAFGFAAGNRSKITVLDIDSTDERELADAMARHGNSPFVVKSISGHYQAYYRWSGEGRRIRPMHGKPVDVLGGGFAVAAPSVGKGGGYQIIAGQLDDLDRLPPLKGGGVGAAVALDHMGENSGRNDVLFRLLGREARACDDLAALMDVATGINASFGAPLPGDEVEKIARNVWRMESEGRNRFGRHGAWFAVDDLSRLLTVLSPQAFALLAFLRANNGPTSQFAVADGLGNRSEFFGWSRRDLPQARKELIKLGLVVPISKAAPGQAAIYAWGSSGVEAPRKGYVEDSIPKLVGVARTVDVPRAVDGFKPVGDLSANVVGRAA